MSILSSSALGTHRFSASFTTSKSTCTSSLPYSRGLSSVLINDNRVHETSRLQDEISSSSEAESLPRQVLDEIHVRIRSEVFRTQDRLDRIQKIKQRRQLAQQQHQLQVSKQRHTLALPPSERHDIDVVTSKELAQSKQSKALQTTHSDDHSSENAATTLLLQIKMLQDQLKAKTDECNRLREQLNQVQLQKKSALNKLNSQEYEDHETCTSTTTTTTTTTQMTRHKERREEQRFTTTTSFVQEQHFSSSSSLSSSFSRAQHMKASDSDYSCGRHDRSPAPSFALLPPMQQQYHHCHWPGFAGSPSPVIGNNSPYSALLYSPQSYQQMSLHSPLFASSSPTVAAPPQRSINNNMPTAVEEQTNSWASLWSLWGQKIDKKTGIFSRFPKWYESFE